MSEAADPARTYLRNKILNASPFELIIILYEGAIASILRAKEVSAPRRQHATCSSLIRAQNMIRELRNALDMSRGEIAAGLYRLYTYMIQRLIDANTCRKTEYLDEVLQMLTELKEAWVQGVGNLGRGIEAQGASENLSITH